METMRPVLALLLLLSGPAAHAQTPNFSGFWTLDREASDITPPAFSGGRGGASIDRLFITPAANDTLVIGTETNGLKAWHYAPGQEGTISVLPSACNRLGRKIHADRRRGHLSPS